MIIKVAILDDNQEFIEYALKVLYKIENIEIDTYTTKSALLEKLQKTNYDVLFVVYEMPDCNGFVVVDQIQSSLEYVILVTSHLSLDISKEGYRRNIFRFITKNFFEAEANEAILSLRKILQRDHCLTIKVGYNEIELDLKGVHFVYSSDHYLIFRTSKQTYRTRLKIVNVKDKLILNQFGECASNTYINLHQIQSIEGNEVRLVNGNLFKISKSKYYSFKRSYQEALYNE